MRRVWHVMAMGGCVEISSHVNVRSPETIQDNVTSWKGIFTGVGQVGYLVH